MLGAGKKSLENRHEVCVGFALVGCEVSLGGPLAEDPMCVRTDNKWSPILLTKR